MTDINRLLKTELIELCKKRGITGYSNKSKEQIINLLQKSEKNISNDKKSQKICFIDTETTGLPSRKSFNSYYDPSDLEKYSSSRVIEIGYIILEIIDNKITSKKEYSSLIKPDNFNINNSEIHGITQEECNNKGIEFTLFLNTFIQDMKDVDLIVAHNLLFDRNILLSEIYRYDKSFYDIFKSKKGLCTMDLGKSKMNIKKSPKLVELYKFLFNEDFLQQHRALDDVIKCMKCYCKMNDVKYD